MRENQDRRQPLAADVSGRLGDMWWAFMLRGALAAVLGLCALIWPSVSLAILIRLVGLYCLADGVAGLIGAFRASERGAHLLQALLGIAVGQIVAARRDDVADSDRSVMTTIGGVAAALGLILIVWPGTGVVAISWVIAIAALLLAALLILLALRLKRVQERVATFARQRR